MTSKQQRKMWVEAFGFVETQFLEKFKLRWCRNYLGYAVMGIRRRADREEQVWIRIPATSALFDLTILEYEAIFGSEADVFSRPIRSAVTGDVEMTNGWQVFSYRCTRYRKWYQRKLARKLIKQLTNLAMMRVVGSKK